MADYLIIGGKNDDSALCALAVAADIAVKLDAQTDIATTPARAPIVRLGRNLRRVVEVDIAPSSTPDVSLDALKNAPSGGWKGMLSFAKKAAQDAAVSARQNFGQYRALADDLRLVRYDAAVDLDADAAGLLAARLASATKVLGFASENIPDAAPGASLLYHDARAVPRSLPRREQCRRLAAAFFGYTLDPRPPWDFIAPPLPANAPAAPFILIGGDIPEPFMEILRAAGLPLFAPDSPADMLAAAQAGECAVGSGVAVSIAAAAGARALFIGGAAHAPPEATTTESPSALQDALAQALTAARLQKSETEESPSPPSAQNLTPQNAAAQKPEDNSASSQDTAHAQESAAEAAETAEKSPSGGLRLKR